MPSDSLAMSQSNMTRRDACRPSECYVVSHVAILGVGMDSSREQVEFFDRIWRQHLDNPRRESSGQRYLRIGSKLVERGVKTVIDVGCGSGLMCKHLARLGVAVTGVDISPVAIEAARHLFAAEGLEGVFEICPSWSVPFATGSFQAAVATYVLDHMTLAQTQLTLGEVRRLLQPGGLLVASFTGTQSPPSACDVLSDGTWKFTAGEMAGLLLRYYRTEELCGLLEDLTIVSIETGADGERLVIAEKPEDSQGTCLGSP